jgi:hypothetical protein
VDFKQVQLSVQVLHQSQALHQQMQRTDAAAVEALHSRGHFVNNVTGPEHRSRLVLPVFGCQSALNPLLAVPEDVGVVSIHSKWPFVGCGCCCDKLNSTNIYGHFELFRLSG